MSLTSKLKDAMSALMRGKITEEEYKQKVKELQAQQRAGTK